MWKVADEHRIQSCLSLKAEKTENKMEDYSGKHLVSDWDNDLFVLYQLDNLLFCLSYSLRHEMYTLVCHTIEEIIEWGFLPKDDTPEWLDVSRLYEWQMYI